MSDSDGQPPVDAADTTTGSSGDDDADSIAARERERAILDAFLGGESIDSLASLHRRPLAEIARIVTSRQAKRDAAAIMRALRLEQALAVERLRRLALVQLARVGLEPDKLPFGADAAGARLVESSRKACTTIVTHRPLERRRARRKSSSDGSSSSPSRSSSRPRRPNPRRPEWFQRPSIHSDARRTPKPVVLSAPPDARDDDVEVESPDSTPGGSSDRDDNQSRWRDADFARMFCRDLPYSPDPRQDQAMASEEVCGKMNDLLEAISRACDDEITTVREPRYQPGWREEAREARETREALEASRAPPG